MSDYFRKLINLVENVNEPVEEQYKGKQTDVIYVVKNENTLGYVNPSQSSGTMMVLAGKPQLGGHDWQNGPVAITRLDNVRVATEEDFDFFRVELPPDFHSNKPVDNVPESEDIKSHQFSQEFKRSDGSNGVAAISVRKIKGGFVGVVKVDGKSKVVTSPVHDMNDAFTMVLRKLDNHKEKIVENVPRSDNVDISDRGDKNMDLSFGKTNSGTSIEADGKMVGLIKSLSSKNKLFEIILAVKKDHNTENVKEFKWVKLRYTASKEYQIVEYIRNNWDKLIKTYDLHKLDNIDI